MDATPRANAADELKDGAGELENTQNRNGKGGRTKGMTDESTARALAEVEEGEVSDGGQQNTEEGRMKEIRERRVTKSPGALGDGRTQGAHMRPVTDQEEQTSARSTPSIEATGPFSTNGSGSRYTYLDATQLRADVQAGQECAVNAPLDGLSMTDSSRATSREPEKHATVSDATTRSRTPARTPASPSTTGDRTTRLGTTDRPIPTGPRARPRPPTVNAGYNAPRQERREWNSGREGERRARTSTHEYDSRYARREGKSGREEERRDISSDGRARTSSREYDSRYGRDYGRRERDSGRQEERREVSSDARAGTSTREYDNVASSRGSSSGRKRGASPLDDPRPSKRISDEQGVGTVFRPYYGTEEEKVQQRIHINNLEQKTSEQEKTIRELKQRVAELARDKYAALKYGRRKMEQIREDDPSKWRELMYRAWAKEHKEQYFTHDEHYEELSDGERDVAEKGTSTDSIEPRRAAYDIEVPALQPMDEMAPPQFDSTSYDMRQNVVVVDPNSYIPTLNADQIRADEQRAATHMYGSMEDYFRAMRARTGWLAGANGFDRVIGFLQGGLPMPVGKEGHPFFKGWAWEDFKSSRLTHEPSNGGWLVGPNDPQFAELAYEASFLDFSFRSNGQRFSVAVALQHPGLKECLWPTVPEPNVHVTCDNNPTFLPAGVRRQYRMVNPPNPTEVYSEFCLSDLSIYIKLHCAGPASATQISKRRWQEMLDYFALEWYPTRGQGVSEPWIDEYFPRGPEPFPEELLVEDFAQDDIMVKLWRHLLRCGLSTEHLAAGFVFDYLQRSRLALRLLEKNREAFKALNPNGDQKASREYTAKHALWFPIPDVEPKVSYPVRDVAGWRQREDENNRIAVQALDEANAMLKAVGQAVEFPSREAQIHARPWFAFVPVPKQKVVKSA
ncbi:hypothetical protein EXIGLDRAFT_764611 [Exidia glandulosa HHB12029]|uniref:Uncharacterized protein n=1 Tax=Exidia glandulosa HHB12029 TaxID=1314781 RepID=A0A165L071_EXIGL|nr:hypothetical protein EXIGLDRAFT_764611 [Exidia glandulosa HHB12029]